MLNLLLKTRQKTDYAVHTHMGNGTESAYAYYCKRKRLQGVLFMGNGDSIIERKSNVLSTASFQFVEDAWNDFRQITF